MSSLRFTTRLYTVFIVGKSSIWRDKKELLRGELYCLVEGKEKEGVKSISLTGETVKQMNDIPLFSKYQLNLSSYRNGNLSSGKIDWINAQKETNLTQNELIPLINAKRIAIEDTELNLS